MNKKYFVVSDIHGYYSILFTNLINTGFDYYNPNHCIIICGDVFDRGNQAKELLKFLLEFQKLNRLILIKGNHEDLLEDCYDQLEAGVNISHHHWRNGTLDTIAQLTDSNKYDLVSGVYDFKHIKTKMKSYFKLMSKVVNYYELKDHIFIHG